jgi:peroxiredoxin
MLKIIKIILLVTLFTGSLFLLVYLGGSKFFPTGENSADLSDGTAIMDKIGSKAPNFDLPSVNGGRVKLSDFYDSPLIVFFWATWNEGSLNQLKIFDDYLQSEKALGRSLVKIVAIDSLEDLSLPSSVIRRGGYEITSAVDLNGSITDSYGIN